jgi:predicted amidohydrolase YtcJ
MEQDLKPIVKLLVENRWPFRIHATYDESIDRMLTVFEEINEETPFDGLRWIIDHAETISEKNLRRVKVLGGGIAIQNRMFFQGEHFVNRYDAEAAATAPPVKKILEMGIPVGLGTDATRVSSYNPWLSLYWIVSGNTWGGLTLYPPENRLDRLTALRLMTKGSAWFSSEEDIKGTIAPGKFADLAVLSADYFSIPEEKIKNLESVLTVVGGKVVYGAAEFADMSPELPPVSPAWSPVSRFDGYYRESLRTSTN